MSIVFSSSGKLAWNHRFNEFGGDVVTPSADPKVLIVKTWNKILHFSWNGELLIEKE